MNNPPNGPFKWGGGNFTRCSFIYIFSIGLFQKKNKQRGVEKILFQKKTPGYFSFLTLPLEISDKTKLHLSENSTKLC